MDALISVIIPVYNVEPYLARCLDSVIQNTYRNLEIICVNDGSPDNCQEILERYAVQDSRVKVIWQENQGLSAARNTGMDAATGDYFYFLDSDDWIHHESFRFLLRAAQETNADITVGGYREVHNESELDPSAVLFYPERVESMMVAEARENKTVTRVMVWGTLYKTTTAGQTRFPKENIVHEDEWYTLEMIHSDEKLRYSYVDLPLYGYCQRAGSIMRKLTLDKEMNMVKYWVLNLSDFSKPEEAVCWVFQQTFFYSLYGKFCKNPETAKRNARIARGYCRPYLWECRKLSKKQKLKMVLNTVFPDLYYAIIKYRDPTYKIYEEGMRKQNKDVILKAWEEL